MHTSSLQKTYFSSQHQTPSMKSLTRRCLDSLFIDVSDDFLWFFLSIAENTYDFSLNVEFASNVSRRKNMGKRGAKAKYLNKTLKVFSTLSNNKHSCFARSRLFNHFAEVMRILVVWGDSRVLLNESMGASIYYVEPCFKFNRGFRTPLHHPCIILLPPPTK